MLFDQVQMLCVYGNVIAEIIPAIAGSSKGIYLSFDPDPGDLALPVAMLFPTIADKGGFIGDFPVFQGTERKGGWS